MAEEIFWLSGVDAEFLYYKKQRANDKKKKMMILNY